MEMPVRCAFVAYKDFGDEFREDPGTGNHISTFRCARPAWLGWVGGCGGGGEGGGAGESGAGVAGEARVDEGCRGENGFVWP